MTQKPDEIGDESNRRVFLAKLALAATGGAATAVAGARAEVQTPAKVALVAGGGTAAVVGAGAGVIAIPAVQRGLTYNKDKDLDGNDVPGIEDPSKYGLQDIKAVELATSQGETFLSWQSTDLKPGKQTLVFFPGNFGHLGHSPDDTYINLIKEAQKQGYQIMAVNHVGFAGSNAQPSQAAIFRGVEKTLEELQEKSIQPKDMYIVGLSMGTTLAAHAANQLAQMGVFQRDPKQHIRALLVNGALNAGVILDDTLPPIISDIAKRVWHEQLDTGKELQEMAALPPDKAKRIHVTYLRGQEDGLTPQGQVEAHEAAAKGLDFVGKEVPGTHFTKPEIMLDALKQFDIAMGNAERGGR